MPVGWTELNDFIPPDVKLPAPLEFPFGSRLAAEFVRMGHEVHVFTLCHFTEGEIHAGRNGLHIHIAGYRDPFRMCYLDGFRVESNRLKKMIREYSCDIYNAHWQYEFARPVIEAGVPHIVTVRDNPWKVLWLFRPKAYRFMRLFLAYYVVRKARHLSVASPYMADYLRKWHHVKGDIPVIPNAVPVFDVNSVTREHHDNKIVFVEIANGFSSCKNVKNLLRAYGLLRKMDLGGKDVELRLYGWGYGPGEECEAWATKHNLSAGVVFRPRAKQRELHAEIAKIGDVFIHSSREESFGAVIVEAMSCGLPTIVGRSSGACPWVAGYGETGLLVNVNNPQEIAEAMRRLAVDGEARRSLAECAVRRAREVFSLDAVAGRYLDLYTNVSNSKYD